MDLADKYRPKLLKDVIGQDDVVKALQGMVKKNSIPHAILFQGHSGCGKTTLARILKAKLECADTEFHDINAADDKGVDMAREITSRIYYAPLGGKSRIYLIDEAHKMTGNAQSLLLKPIEEPPEWAYFFLCTTDPNKIIRTVRDRCVPLTIAPVPAKLIREHVQKIADKEKIPLAKSVLDTIVECADGSVRRALKALTLVSNFDGDEEKQKNVVVASDPRKVAESLVRLLLWSQGVTWEKIAAVIRDVEDDPEQIRRHVLASAATELLKAGKNSARAAIVINFFRDNWYECGKAGLVSACYEIFRAK